MPAAARISLEAMGGAAAGILAGLMALGASELLFDDCADNPICISIFLMRSSRTSRGSTTHFTSASSSGSRSSTPSRRLASLWSNSSTPLRAAWCSTGSWPSSGWMVDIINRHYGRWFNRIYDMDAAALANAERAALGEAVQLKALLSP